MEIIIVDYGMCNLGSVKRAFEECGANAFISDNPRDLKEAAKIVLPGVGSFGDGMANLRSMGWVSAIRHAVLDERIPILGICLGMQLLAGKGHEGGETEGLDLIPGEVKRFVSPASDVRIPHVGWNEVYPRDRADLFRDIDNGTDFYFVHSYHFIPGREEEVLATTPYCGGFVSSARSGVAFGVQFHPEKSSLPGFQLLRNFIAF